MVMKNKKCFGALLLMSFVFVLASCGKSPASEVPATETNIIGEPGIDVPTTTEESVAIEEKSEAVYYSAPLENYQQNNFVWFYKPPAYTSQVNYLIDNYSFFILTKNDEWMRDEILGVNENLEIPEYILFNSIYKNEGCVSDPWQNQIAFHQSDYCWIQNEHPEWFLRSSDGRIIVDGNSVYINPLAEGWVEFYTERLHEAQTIFGWNGLFFDNLDASANRFHSKGVSLADYPDDASYVEANLSFLNQLTALYIEPTGLNVYANITYLDFPTTVWREYLKYLDGFMLEDWAVDWSDGYQNVDEWVAKLEMVDEALKNGKKVFLVAQGNELDEAHQTFAYASYLLVARENVYFRYSDATAYNEVWQLNVYSENLGDPTCDFYVKDSVYIREFTNGRVVVDPETEVAAITVFE